MQYTVLYRRTNMNRNDNLIAALANIPILFWLPVVTNTTPLGRHYANQGLIALIFTILLRVLSNIPLVGWLTAAAEVVLWVFLIINFFCALRGEAREIPFLGSLLRVF